MYATLLKNLEIQFFSRNITAHLKVYYDFFSNLTAKIIA